MKGLEVVAGYLIRLDLRRFGLTCNFPFEDIAVLSRLRKLSLQRNGLQVGIRSILPHPDMDKGWPHPHSLYCSGLGPHDSIRIKLYIHMRWQCEVAFAVVKQVQKPVRHRGVLCPCKGAVITSRGAGAGRPQLCACYLPPIHLHLYVCLLYIYTLSVHVQHQSHGVVPFITLASIVTDGDGAG